MSASISNNRYAQFSPVAGYEMFSPILRLRQQSSGFSPCVSQGTQNALSYLPNALTPPSNVEELGELGNYARSSSGSS